MDMIVRSGTTAISMDMALLEQRMCVPTFSGGNLSLDAPTRYVLALMVEIILEALTEQITLSVQ